MVVGGWLVGAIVGKRTGGGVSPVGNCPSQQGVRARQPQRRRGVEVGGEGGHSNQEGGGREGWTGFERWW